LTSDVGETLSTAGCLPCSSRPTTSRVSCTSTNTRSLHHVTRHALSHYYIVRKRHNARSFRPAIINVESPLFLFTRSTSVESHLEQHRQQPTMAPKSRALCFSRTTLDHSPTKTLEAQTGIYQRQR